MVPLNAPQPSNVVIWESDVLPGENSDDYFSDEMQAPVGIISSTQKPSPPNTEILKKASSRPSSFDLLSDSPTASPIESVSDTVKKRADWLKRAPSGSSEQVAKKKTRKKKDKSASRDKKST